MEVSKGRSYLSIIGKMQQQYCEKSPVIPIKKPALTITKDSTLEEKIHFINNQLEILYFNYYKFSGINSFAGIPCSSNIETIKKIDDHRAYLLKNIYILEKNLKKKLAELLEINLKLKRLELIETKTRKIFNNIIKQIATV